MFERWCKDAGDSMMGGLCGGGNQGNRQNRKVDIK